MEIPVVQTAKTNSSYDKKFRFLINLHELR